MVKRLAAVAALTLLAGCDWLIPTYTPADPTPIGSAVVTADGTDAYSFTTTTGTVEAQPLDGNTGANLRMVFWPSDGPIVTDQQTCATWSSAVGPMTQEGAALRVIDGHAITVTKNVWAGAQWIFNLHVWAAGVGTMFGQFDLGAVFNRAGTLSPLPWHLCARALRGVFSFKAWPDYEREPSWSDATHGGSALIPTGWETPGRAGWYVGHLPPGGQATYSALTAWRFT